MRWRMISRLGMALAGLSACAQAGPSTPKQRDIILVGDSTVSSTTGWGDAFCQSMVAKVKSCTNLARAGRSSRSFRKEGSWKSVLQKIKDDGASHALVLIQFGHNDAGKDEKRRTDPDADFTDIISQYVDDVRSLNAEPILITPVARRIYVDGKIRDGLEPYAGAVRRIAAAKRTSLIDLHAMSVAALEKMSPGEARGLGPDGTQPDINHLGPKGARYFADMVIRQLRL